MLHRLRLQLSRLRASLARRPTVELPRRRWHSVSSCSEYERCPRRYRYGYVDRLREDRPVPASWRYGSVVHTALEAAYRARAEGVPLAWTTPVAIDAFHAAWIDEAMPDDPDWLARGEELVHSVLANDRLATDEIIGVEHCFKYETDGGRQFVGFADLVVRRDPTTVEIIDHKVTRHARDEDSLLEDPQLNLYGWFALREWPWATRVLATHHYPTLDQTVTVELDRAEMDSTFARLAEIAEHAEADTAFEPNPGPECSHCPWIARCPAHAEEHAA